MSAPAPLLENLPFAFRGEQLEAVRLVSPAEAERLGAARNVTGKLNTDVLREFIRVDRDGNERRTTAIDFPATMTVAEAQLYAGPFTVLARGRLPLHSPHRDDALRNALARLERFLACPADETEPTFAWIEGDVLPDDSLVVWARDDDFSAGVLASHAFGLWCAHCGELLAALRSFPFPWPPATPLSALSRAQEEQRFALARAARSEDADAIEIALAAAHGWPTDLDDADLLARLTALHSERSRHR
jgi:hypothetical protein